MLALNKIVRIFPKFLLRRGPEDQLEKGHWEGQPREEMSKGQSQKENAWLDREFQKPGRLDDGVCGGARVGRLAVFIQILQGAGLGSAADGKLSQTSEQKHHAIGSVSERDGWVWAKDQLKRDQIGDKGNGPGELGEL